MQLGEFISLIPGKHKKTGAGYMVHCPAHEDKTPSMSVGERDGKILVKCFAGCRAETIMSKMGLSMSDLFTEERTAEEKAEVIRKLNTPKEVAKYEYFVQDESALDEWRLTGWKSRYEPKDFRWFKADGSSGRPVEKTLYNFRAVVENFKEPVFLVEGEKDVETLKKLGLIAICSPDGCNAWEDSYTNALVGATVRIIPDNDEPGYKFALSVYERLKAGGISVSIHPLTKVKDVSEWKNISAKKLQGVPKKTVSAVKKILSDRQKESVARKASGDAVIDRLKEILDGIEGKFHINDIYRETEAYTAAEKRAVRAYLNRMATDGHIQKDRGVSGRFCASDSELEYMDWESVSAEKSNIWLPLGISEMVDIMPGNIIVLAGQGNAGKSTMVKRIALENLRRGMDVYLFNSEAHEVEFHNSLLRDFGRARFDEFAKFKEEGRFKVVSRSGGFDEVIRPHALNIIDFLEIHTDFAEAGAYYKKIHDALGDGICIVCQQLRVNFGKDGKKYVGYGVGGEATAEKARLYMCLTQDWDKHEYQIEIKKAKMWPKDKPNPNFKKIKFEFIDGEYYEKIEIKDEWRR